MRLNTRTTALAAAAILIATAALLLAAGRPAICTCGHVDLWHGAIDSGNSQHLLDWYSPSHLIHGLLFYGAGWLAVRLWRGAHTKPANASPVRAEHSRSTDQERTASLTALSSVRVERSRDTGHTHPGSLRLRFLLALTIEAAWELLENSPMVIDRYRTATIALGYTGDSVLNSLSDIGCMALGFALARRLPVPITIALAIGFELLTLWVIRDNLTLNILMLLAPIGAIRHWQAG